MLAAIQNVKGHIFPQAVQLKKLGNSGNNHPEGMSIYQL